MNRLFQVNKRIHWSIVIGWRILKDVIPIVSSWHLFSGGFTPIHNSVHVTNSSQAFWMVLMAYIQPQWLSCGNVVFERLRTPHKAIKVINQLKYERNKISPILQHSRIAWFYLDIVLHNGVDLVSEPRFNVLTLGKKSCDKIWLLLIIHHYMISTKSWKMNKCVLPSYKEGKVQLPFCFTSVIVLLCYLAFPHSPGWCYLINLIATSVSLYNCVTAAT